MAGTKNQVATRLLGTLVPEHFKYPPTVEAFTRIKTILANDGQLPSWIDLINDPSLDQSNRDLWAEYDKRPLKSTRKGRRLIQRLEEYRLARQVFYRSKQNINTLRKDKVNIEELLSKNQTCLLYTSPSPRDS